MFDWAPGKSELNKKGLSVAFLFEKKSKREPIDMTSQMKQKLTESRRNIVNDKPFYLQSAPTKEYRPMKKHT